MTNIYIPEKSREKKPKIYKINVENKVCIQIVQIHLINPGPKILIKEKVELRSFKMLALRVVAWAVVVVLNRDAISEYCCQLGDCASVPVVARIFCGRQIVL